VGIRITITSFYPGEASGRTILLTWKLSQGFILFLSKEKELSKI